MTKAVSPSQLFKNCLVFEACLIVFSFALFTFLKYSPPIYGGAIIATIATAILGAIATYVVLVSILNANAYMRAQSQLIYQRIIPMFQGLRLWQLVLIAIAAGVGEELMFRAGIQQALMLKMNPWIAIIVASIIFGALHAMTVLYFVLATLIGFALGVAYYLTQDLIAVMAWHAIYDLIALCILVYRPDLLYKADRHH